eukprot:s42_g3.t1
MEKLSAMWHSAAVCCDARGILERATEALRKHFGFGSLRDFQSKAIGAWAEGKDVLITLGTGTGKSLCFQLPPLARSDGRCSVVISPLISLMQDQLRTLRQRQIPVSCCGAAGGSPTLGEALDAARGGVVYMSPEYALSRLSLLNERKDSVCLLAIDEAHCISAWGHDFRKTYQQLGQVRDALGKPPTMALTATCTNEVQKDIRSCLGLTPENTVLVQGSINRPNLKLLVRPRSTLEEDFAEIFQLNQGSDRTVENTSVNPMSSTIVYVLTRARSEEVANWFQMKGVKAAAYHAGLSPTARQELHRLFMLDQLQVMVATIAFGMGIDKPSIRRVIHYGGIQSLAHFVQQCGRAGRDGEDAECITFHRAQDAREIRNVMLHSVETSSQVFQQRQLELNNELNAYLADSSQCRRVGLLRHFGEQPKVISAGAPWVKGECVRVGETGEPNCQWCDVCLNPRRRPEAVAASLEVDFTAECLILLDCVFACRGFTGRALPLQVAVGQSNQQVRSKKLHQHRAFGSGGAKSHSWWKAFLPHVLQRGLLQEKPARLANGFSYAAISLSEAGHTMLQTRCGSFLMCPVPEELNVVKAPTPSPSVTVVRSSGVATAPMVSALEEKVQLLYRRLSHVRQQWMRRLNIMGESIISNPLLRTLAEQRPRSVADAQQLPGLPQTLQRELRDLLEALVEEIKTTSKDLSLPQSSSSMDPPDAADATKRRKLPWEDPSVNVKVLRSSVLAGPVRSEPEQIERLGRSPEKVDLDGI